MPDTIACIDLHQLACDSLSRSLGTWVRQCSSHMLLLICWSNMYWPNIRWSFVHLCRQAADPSCGLWYPAFVYILWLDNFNPYCVLPRVPCRASRMKLWTLSILPTLRDCSSVCCSHVFCGLSQKLLLKEVLTPTFCLVSEFQVVQFAWILPVETNRCKLW